MSRMGLAAGLSPGLPTRLSANSCFLRLCLPHLHIGAALRAKCFPGGKGSDKASSRSLGTQPRSPYLPTLGQMSQDPRIFGTHMSLPFY